MRTLGGKACRAPAPVRCTCIAVCWLGPLGRASRAVSLSQSACRARPVRTWRWAQHTYRAPTHPPTTCLSPCRRSAWQAATGEVVSAEDLGGADVHCRISGVTDHYATDEAHGLALARRVVANLNPPRRAELAMSAPEDPLFDPAELAGIVPADARKVRARAAGVWE